MFTNHKCSPALVNKLLTHIKITTITKTFNLMKTKKQFQKNLSD